uniref:Uncharacterized protein n=1 Tax=Lotharella vacuolata TaxID=74820 RepID=A0A0H5BHC6_9EUKA|nr:hypothetical protein [Lotharella vacuolata]
MLFCNICNSLIYFHKAELNSLICNVCKNQKKSTKKLIIKYKNWTPGSHDLVWTFNNIKMGLCSFTPIISKFRCIKCSCNNFFFFLKKNNGLLLYFFCTKCKTVYIKKV